MTLKEKMMQNLKKEMKEITDLIQKVLKQLEFYPIEDSHTRKAEWHFKKALRLLLPSDNPKVHNVGQMWKNSSDITDKAIIVDVVDDNVSFIRTSAIKPFILSHMPLTRFEFTYDKFVKVVDIYKS